MIYTLQTIIYFKRLFTYFSFILFVSIMLGLNFYIFWMRFATNLDIKLFSEKIEKDFQFTGVGGGVTRPYRAFPGAGGPGNRNPI